MTHGSVDEDFFPPGFRNFLRTIFFLRRRPSGKLFRRVVNLSKHLCPQGRVLVVYLYSDLRVLVKHRGDRADPNAELILS